MCTPVSYTHLGKLYGVGVGPGDSKLLTIKAKEILESADVIAVPVKAPGAVSYTHLDVYKRQGLDADVRRHRR